MSSSHLMVQEMVQSMVHMMYSNNMHNKGVCGNKQQSYRTVVAVYRIQIFKKFFLLGVSFLCNKW